MQRTELALAQARDDLLWGTQGLGNRVEGHTRPLSLLHRASLWVWGVGEAEADS